jgi:hypothetical protein
MSIDGLHESIIAKPLRLSALCHLFMDGMDIPLGK